MTGSMSGVSDGRSAKPPEIKKVGFAHGDRVPPERLERVKVGDALVDAMGRRHTVRKVFKIGLRIESEAFGVQD